MASRMMTLSKYLLGLGLDVCFMTKDQLLRLGELGAIRVNGTVIRNPESYFVLNGDEILIGKDDLYTVDFSEANKNDTQPTLYLGEIRPFPAIKADKAQATKILEESSEIFSAWENYSRALLDADAQEAALSKQDLLDECADAIMAISNMIFALGVTDFAPYMRKCFRRNEERGRYDA